TLKQGALEQTEHAVAGETKPPFMPCSCCLSLINKCFSLQRLPGGVALSSKRCLFGFIFEADPEASALPKPRWPDSAEGS
uniref:Uncharacterized protein n=1 Tax=Catharus ustulatus TaxID=91951 RepID=A0A8C3UKI8_CATUS